MKIAVLDINGVQSTKNGKVRYYYSVDDAYDFGSNSATDMTSIVDLKLFHSLFRINYNEYKDSLSTLYSTLTYGNLSSEEQKILSKNFVVDKTKRDTFYSYEEQKDYALLMQQLEKESDIEENLKSNVTDIINDVDVTLVGELSNYNEMFESFDGVINNVWHKVTLNNVAPNSVIMISIYSTWNTKWGGVREVNSTLDRKRDIKVNSSFSLPVKVDANKQIEVYRENSYITFSVTAQLS